MSVKVHPQLDERRLRLLLDDGLRRARRQGRPILVSSVQRLPACDPLALSTRGISMADERLFWSCPGEGFAMAGVGAAWAFSVHGPRRFSDVSAVWRDCCADALVDSEGDALGTGPVVLGGFAFDPARSSTALWDGYPDGRVVLSRYLLTTAHDVTWLTTNRLIRPDSDVDAELQTIVRERQTLLPKEIEESRGSNNARQIAPGDAALTVEDLLPAARWQTMVQTLVQGLGQGDREKVVLARACRVQRATPFDLTRIVGQLRAEYPDCFVFSISHNGRCFLGASPERLVRLRQGGVWATCLAGSIARGATVEEDQRLGETLLGSTKDRAEHAVVVDALRSALAEVCVGLQGPSSPTLLKLANVQHLFTPIVGRVRDGRAILDVVEHLHPTPGVGGHPREAALRWIREHEGLDRGWYAGPVGWVDARGEGEFAVAIRSALIEGARATLFTGCGIVAGSDPVSEYAESCLKLRPILRALGWAGP